MPTPVQRICADQARTLLARSGVLVLDARDPVDFARGRIDSAVHVGSDTVLPIVSRTPKSVPVLIYCYHGKASQEYGRMFVDFGFREVYSLDGGFEAWQRSEADPAPLVPSAVLGETTRNWLVGQGFSAGNTARADGMTPLMAAARLGNAAIVAELLHAGVDRDTRNADGNTALWMACVGGASEVIELLVSAGCNLDNQNDNGATCLMYAASKGNPWLTARLIAAGADLSRETLDGFTALDMAADRESLNLLRRAESRTVPANR